MIIHWTRCQNPKHQNNDSNKDVKAGAAVFSYFFEKWFSSDFFGFQLLWKMWEKLQNWGWYLWILLLLADFGNIMLKNLRGHMGRFIFVELTCVFSSRLSAAQLESSNARDLGLELQVNLSASAGKGSWSLSGYMSFYQFIFFLLVQKSLARRLSHTDVAKNLTAVTCPLALPLVFALLSSSASLPWQRRSHRGFATW